jgi:cysteine desulfurase
MERPVAPRRGYHYHRLDGSSRERTVEPRFVFKHSKPLYFDYQASTPLDGRVFEAMRPFYETAFGNPHSGEHLHGQSAFAAIEIARNEIAGCIGAEGEDMIFTSGASEANNLAILGAARAHNGRRTKILVTNIEHSSVLESASNSGLEIIYIPVNYEGQVDLAFIESALSDRVLLVSVGMVNNEIGTVQDIARIANLVQGSGALFHVDAAQALNGSSISVSDCPVDFVSLSSHKAYGPKGIGALYIAPGKRANLRPLIFGGGQEHGLRAGTLPTPLCVGFGAACSIIRQSGELERSSVAARRDYFLDRIRARIPGTVVIGPEKARHVGNLSLKMPINDARDLVQLIRTAVSCSTGSACHSGADEPSHVLTSIGLPVTEARKVIRLSLGRFTSSADCDYAAEVLAEATEMLQKLALPPPTGKMEASAH